MTDEEIAKVANEKANEKYPIPRVWCEIELVRNCSYERGFIDGVKYGFLKSNEWHDLRQNPNDLPKRDKRFVSNISISVMTQENNFACYYFDDKKWYSYGVEITPPIAWCEIPQFEECDANNEM